AVIVLIAFAGAAAAAEPYPARAIRYVVASAPGGIADLTARLLAPRLSQALGQPVVVENRTAGGILVGAELVARAAPDGHTLFSATPQVAIAQSMYKKAAFNPRRELAPVALVGLIPNVLVVNPKTPAASVRELVELARAQPGKLNYSSTGAGTPAPVINVLENEIRRALEDPQTAALYERVGLTVHFLGAQAFGAFWDAEIEKFALAVKHSGATVEWAMIERRELNYAPSLKAHFYAPQGAGKFPAVIAVHGGGWRLENLELYRDLGPWLAEHG